MSATAIPIVIVTGLGIGILSGLPFRAEPEAGAVTPDAKPQRVAVSAIRATPDKQATDPLYELLSADLPEDHLRIFNQLIESALRDPFADTNLLKLSAERWAASDPAGMFAHLLEHDLFSPHWVRRPRNLDLAEILFSNWTGSDPRAAAGAAAELAGHPKHPSGAGFKQVFWTAFETAPQTARELVLKHPDMQLAIGFDSPPEERVPIAALDLIASLPESPKRSFVLGQFPFGFRDTAADIAERWDWFDRQEASVQVDSLPSMLTSNKRVSHSEERLETMRTLATGRPFLARWLVSEYGLEFAEFDLQGTEDWIKESFSGQDEFHTLRELRRHARKLTKP